MPFALSIGSLFVSSLALSAPLCPPTRSQLGVYDEINARILKAAQYDANDRQTAAEFGKKNNESAAVVEHRYGASGDLKCEQFGFISGAQAQLVMRGDTILANAHGLFFGSACEKPFSLNACTFTIEREGKKTAYKIDSQLASGWKCPPPTEKANALNKDWVILKLKKSVDPKVKPYQLVDPPCANEIGSADVVAVGKSVDYRLNGKISPDAKHYARCEIIRSACFNSTAVMKSNCDSDHGSSGSGLFLDEKNPKVFGIVVAMVDACPKDAKARTGPYNAACFHAQSIPIAGDLKKELEGLVGPPVASPKPTVTPPKPPATSPTPEVPPLPPTITPSKPKTTDL